MPEYEFEFEEMQNARFREVDLSGARMHSMNLSNLKVTDAFIFNVELSGIVGNLKVNDVDVTGYVEAELNKRYPERLLLAPTDPAGFRTGWDAVTGLWAKTMERARALPDATLDESVDGEYTFLETLRHLVFAIDRWITEPVL
ncbi:MAG TPA: DinB family protein, partial [Acidimicrobiia bacterium]|nr:DinB family protein [Acidimicrobiia bacterium]